MKMKKDGFRHKFKKDKLKGENFERFRGKIEEEMVLLSREENNKQIKRKKTFNNLQLMTWKN